MGYGGYHCYPRRFGGNKYGGKPLTEVIHESLNRQRGPAYSVDPDSIVWCENFAYARCIAWDGWELNARLALQWDPQRTTIMLPSWVTIFAIPANDSWSDREIREELTRRWQRFGKVANHSYLTSELQRALGPFFHSLNYIPIAQASVKVPEAGYPWGTVVDGLWSSTTAHFLVRLVKPSNATEGDFYAMAGKVPQILDPIVSSFVTFDWYRSGTLDWTIGSLGGLGFKLDDEHNLDNQLLT